MKRRNDTFAQLLVGLFMVTVLLLLGYFTIVISGIDVLSGRERARVRIAFDQVGGLKEHDSVMYRGTKVGTVERVAVTPSNLVVTASVDGGVVLRRGYRASVCSLSMLGGNYLMLEEGEGEEMSLADGFFFGESPTDWMADVARIARNVKELSERIELTGIVTNLEAASASVKEVAARVERGEGLVGKIMAKDDALYDSLCETAENARSITGQLNRRELYDSLQEAIGDFRQACSNMNFEGAIADFRQVCTNVIVATDGVDVRGTAERAKALMDNLNGAVERLKAGEGTLGRLAADDALYRELEGLVRDCRQIIDNYRDSTPITTFATLATGAL